MKQIKGAGKCWFCDEICEDKHYWHVECKTKFMSENS